MCLSWQKCKWAHGHTEFDKTTLSLKFESEYSFPNPVPDPVEILGPVLFRRTGDGARYLVPSFLSNGIRGQHPGPVLFDRRDDGARYLVPSLLSNGIRGQHPGPVLFEIRDDGARYLVPSFLPGTWSRDGPNSNNVLLSLQVPAVLLLH